MSQIRRVAGGMQPRMVSHNPKGALDTAVRLLQQQTRFDWSPASSDVTQWLICIVGNVGARFWKTVRWTQNGLFKNKWSKSLQQNQRYHLFFLFCVFVILTHLNTTCHTVYLKTVPLSLPTPCCSTMGTFLWGETKLVEMPFNILPSRTVFFSWCSQVALKCSRYHKGRINWK